MFNFLQISFNSVMIDLPDKHHVWDTPARQNMFIYFEKLAKE